ncbi:hypothetical protein ENUP19_0246G0013 [Entamoeba nuttalli]|uniref:Ras guanine nucleotide exchange factor, putative n=2 Tax=Entamoeba nuttalli TaxID=412467 RepID=K2H6F3_ENTNP|nr:Ras guanine nucleotide exchange factor, putative [Entamoeba nuttalli P19]EKE38074.1 Ras guanine nucleotide exchange factor, putative [Entamoeba nuttalli P19]|eukprot:XP_008859585.1 Ras guanine nucleotide exchange factor, putative [Entamoeba nuttalli P19]
MNYSTRGIQEITHDIYSLIGKVQQGIKKEGEEEFNITNKISELIDELSYCIPFTPSTQDKVINAFNTLDSCSEDGADLLGNLLSIQTIVVEITGILPPPPPRKKSGFSSIKPTETNTKHRSTGFLNRQGKFNYASPSVTQSQKPFLRRESSTLSSSSLINSRSLTCSEHSLIQTNQYIDIMKCLPPDATTEQIEYILNRVKEMLEKRKKELEIKLIKPNYSQVFKSSKHGDIVSVYRECQANATANKIISGMNIKEAIKQYYESIDIFFMERNGLPTQLDVAGFAIRKSSTKMRIIAAMTRKTHFLKQHEIENDDMWSRMEEYEKVAYVELIKVTATVPALIEDITCFGALEKFTELEIAANALKEACVQLVNFVPQVFLKAAQVVGERMEQYFVEATEDMKDIFNSSISKLKEIDIHSGRTSSGIIAVESASKALQAAGSELLGVVWEIIHFKPKDEGKMTFQPYEKAVLRIDRGYRLEHICLLELIAICTSVMNNLRLYIAALKTLGENNVSLTSKINCSDSLKVISIKGKVVAGGLIGLLIEGRNNDTVKDVIYSVLAHYGGHIGEILRKLPQEHCAVITQTIIQTLYNEINIPQVWEFLNEGNSPMNEALKVRMSTAEDIIKKERARCMSPIYDFFVPSEPKSPLILLAELDSMTIARQLTAISFDQYFKLRTNDFFSKGTSIQLIQARINDLSNWTCNSVLSFTDFESRAFMKNHFIEILKKLQELGDFNSAFGIFDGLLHISIVFGTKYISEKANKFIDETSKLYGNFKSLKVAYKKRSVCIPYIGSVLESIEEIKREEPFFYQQKGEDEKYINFVQSKEIYDVVVDYLKYQKEDYYIAKIEPLHSYLTNLPCFDKSVLDKLREYHE